MVRSSVYSELSPSCGIPDVISLVKCFVPVVDSVTVDNLIKDVGSLLVATHVSGLVVVNEVTGGHEMFSEFLFLFAKKEEKHVTMMYSLHLLRKQLLVDSSIE